MKSFRVFIFLMVILFFAGIMVDSIMPKPFNWNKTYSAIDKNPFGCYVFDSVMRKVCKNGYSVDGRTFMQINREKTSKKRSLLLVCPSDCYDIQDSIADSIMLSFIAKGNDLLLVNGFSKSYDEIVPDTVASANLSVSSLPRRQCNIGIYDTLGICPDKIGPYFNFSISDLRKSLNEGLEKAHDTIFWTGDRQRYPRAIYNPYRMMVEYGYKVLQKKDGVDYLAYDVHGVKYISMKTVPDSCLWPVAVSRKIGKGRLVVCSVPMLFTNYGILDDDSRGFVMRMMSQISRHQIVRLDESVGSGEEIIKNESALRVITENTPLRTAYYLLLFAVMLFMIFTARRRQRIIPVVKPQMNRNLEFVKNIGSLYYYKRDNTSLVQRKYIYFAERIRNMTDIDIDEIGNDEHIFRKLSGETGIDRDEIEDIIKNLRLVINSEDNISMYDMRTYIDQMNRILNAL